MCLFIPPLKPKPPEGRRASVVLKIDFEKAYDYVEWGFSDFVLEEKEFGYMERMDSGLPFNGLIFNFH